MSDPPATDKKPTSDRPVPDKVAASDRPASDKVAASDRPGSEHGDASKPGRTGTRKKARKRSRPEPDAPAAPTPVEPTSAKRAPVETTSGKPAAAETTAARPAADERPGGFLTVNSFPFAQVTIAGRTYTTPETRIPLAAGRHTLHATRSDGREQDVAFEIEPGRERRLVLQWGGP